MERLYKVGFDFLACLAMVGGGEVINCWQNSELSRVRLPPYSNRVKYS